MGGADGPALGDVGRPAMERTRRRFRRLHLAASAGREFAAGWLGRRFRGGWRCRRRRGAGAGRELVGRVRRRRRRRLRHGSRGGLEGRRFLVGDRLRRRRLHRRPLFVDLFRLDLLGPGNGRALVVSELVDRGSAAGQRGSGGGHGSKLLPRGQLGRRLRPLAQRRRPGRSSGGGRSAARSRALASPSASADSRGASFAHSIPPRMPATRTASAWRPSVRQRFTFV
jgi:hypothetical protein